jgi:NitT/TauT family transport system substrate-binding protein
MRRLLSLTVGWALLLLAVACGPSAAPAPAKSASGSPSPTTSAAPASQPSGGASSAGKGAPAVHVNVVYAQQSISVTQLYLAQTNGYFKKYGLNATLTQAGGPTSMAALTSGEAQFCVCGATEAIDADLRGGQVVMIGALGNYPNFSLYANPAIHSVKDLVGKTVAMPSLGGPVVPTTNIILAHYGVSPSKVHYLGAGNSVAGVLALMIRGTAQAGTMPPPFTGQAQQKGFRLLAVGSSLGVPMTTTSLEVTRTYLKAHPTVVEGFLRAMVEAWQFAQAPANQAAVVSVIEHYTHAKPAVATEGYTYFRNIWDKSTLPVIDPQGVANAMKYSGQAEQVKLSNNVSRFIDPSLLQQVAGSGASGGGSASSS